MIVLAPSEQSVCRTEQTIIHAPLGAVCFSLLVITSTKANVQVFGEIIFGGQIRVTYTLSSIGR